MTTHIPDGRLIQVEYIGQWNCDFFQVDEITGMYEIKSLTAAPTEIEMTSFLIQYFRSIIPEFELNRMDDIASDI